MRPRSDSNTLTTIIGFALIAVILIGSQMLLKPKRTQPPPTTPARPAPAPAETTKPAVAEPAPTIAVLKAEPAPETTVTLRNDLLLVEFSNVGGAITSARLDRYDAEVVPSGGSLLGTAVLVGQSWLSLGATPMRVSTTDTSVTFTARTESLTVTKTYTLREDYTLGYRIGLGHDPESPEDSGHVPARGLAIDALAGLALTEKNVKEGLAHFHFYAKTGKKLHQTPAGRLKKPVGSPEPADWAGVKSKYFLLALIAGARTLDSTYAAALEDGRIGFSAAVRNPGPQTEFTVYLGPIEYDRLRAFGIGLDNVLGLGWARPIAVAMLWFLRFLFSVVRNWGVAIIIFSILMKAAFYPLTRTQTRQMRQMQLLQPKLNELKAKYKDDSQKLNAETMQLYRLYKINPASGCLPLLVQMPVFWALYAVLRNAIEMRGAALGLWLRDMSEPDMLFGHLPAGIPMIGGSAIGLLPVLMGVSFIGQNLLTSTDKRNMAMTIIFPIFITLIFLNMPSGLQLYWFMYNVLSIGESIISLKGGLPWGKSKGRRDTVPAASKRGT